MISLDGGATWVKVEKIFIELERLRLKERYLKVRRPQEWAEFQRMVNHAQGDELQSHPGQLANFVEVKGRFGIRPPRVEPWEVPDHCPTPEVIKKTYSVERQYLGNGLWAKKDDMTNPTQNETQNNDVKQVIMDDLRKGITSVLEARLGVPESQWTNDFRSHLTESLDEITEFSFEYYTTLKAA